MDIWQNLLMGFDIIFSWQNLLLITGGSIIGTLVGALPGLGPSAGIALLLPLTFGMSPTSALALLTSIYLGTMFGGRITAILINVPGDAPAIMTATDGYPLMLQGKGGVAMGISAIASFLGGIVAMIVLAIGAPTVARWTIHFGPAEYFALMVMGLATISSMAGKSLLKALAMTFLGVVVAMVGSDAVSGFVRFAPFPELIEGVDFVAIIIGVYGLGEVLINIETAVRLDFGKVTLRFKELFPTWSDIRKVLPATGRGSIIGTLVGILPGAGGTVATFIAYSSEKNMSKDPDKFGKGAIEGVAAPESANNASVGGALVPLLALGVPGSGGTAVLLGALIVFGLRPGPLIFTEAPDVVWTIIASLFVANFMLLIANIVLIPFFVNAIRVSQNYLSPLVTLICVVGAFSLNYGTFDIWVALLFGVIGYFMKKLSYPGGPFILAVVLAPLAESSLRQSLILSDGSFSIFFTRPIALALMLIALVSLVIPFVQGMRKTGGDSSRKVSS